MTAVVRPDGWPDLAPAARYGIAGKVVDLLAPHTEADPAGLLATFLAMAANAIGSGPQMPVYGRAHKLRINIALVGHTGGGRKGSAHGSVVPVFERAAPDWADKRCQSGLASGEGLIAAVADGSGDDPGVTDKRLFITEQEFGRPLRISTREGNTLSFVVREAWDSDKLANLTRKEPQHATGAHIGIVGHVTFEELADTLARADIWNGFANRFLWVVVNRSQLLPSGGGLEESDYDQLGREVQAALEGARRIARMRRTADAEAVWDSAYRALAMREVSGPLAAVTNRADAQALRLSMIYAALDGSSSIEVAHLEAAWAFLWYCEQSAAVIFGERASNGHGDRILAAMRQKPEGVGTDRTELHKVFSGNVTAKQLDAVLGELEALEAVEKVVAPSDGKPGRPRTLYYLRGNELNERTKSNGAGYRCASSFLSFHSSSQSTNGVKERARAAAAVASE